MNREANKVEQTVFKWLKINIYTCIMDSTIKKIILLPLLVIFCSVSCLQLPAKAAIIGTETMLKIQMETPQDTIRTFLEREDVKEQLIQFGVDPIDAQSRIAVLSDEELQQLHNRINDLPAGSDALAVLGVVFLVLLILELVGVTNIFSKL